MTIPDLQKMQEEELYQEIIEIFDTIPEAARNLDHYYTYIYALNKISDFRTAMELFIELRTRIHELSEFDQLKYYYQYLISLFRIGEYSNAKETLSIVKGYLDRTNYDTLTKGERTTYSSYYNHAGIINWAQGNLDEALRNYEILQDLGMKNENLKVVAVAKINSALIEEHYGRYNRAIDNYYEAIELGWQLNDQGTIITTYNNLVSAYGVVGRLAEAEKMAKKGIDVASKLNDKMLLSKLLTNRGEIYRKKGKLDKSEQDLLDSYGYKIEIGNVHELIIILQSLVELYLDMGDRKTAMNYLKKLKKVDDGNNSTPYLMMKARYLKGSSLIRHQSQAEKIYRELLKRDDIHLNTRIVITLQLLEMLIRQVDEEEEQELLLKEERDEMMEELMELYNSILDIQEVIEAPLIQLQIYYVRAYLHLFFLQPELVQGELEKAWQIAEEIGVNILDFNKPELSQLTKSASIGPSLQKSLNNLIHAEPRLKIILALINNSKLVFTELQKLVGLTPGNMGRHCDKLVEAGYIIKQKEVVNDRFLTTYSISPEGINEFQRYQNIISPYFKQI